MAPLLWSHVLLLIRFTWCKCDVVGQVQCTWHHFSENKLLRDSARDRARKTVVVSSLVSWTWCWRGSVRCDLLRWQTPIDIRPRSLFILDRSWTRQTRRTFSLRHPPGRPGDKGHPRGWNANPKWNMNHWQGQVHFSLIIPIRVVTKLWPQRWQASDEWQLNRWATLSGFYFSYFFLLQYFFMVVVPIDLTNETPLIIFLFFSIIGKIK